MLLLLFLLVALPIFIFFIFLLTIQHKSRRHLPPGPKGLPFIGNVHQLDVSKPHIWLAKHSAKYGPIIFFKLCRLPVIGFSSANVAKHVYKYNDVAFAGRPYSSAWFRLSYEGSDIIGSPYSDYWRKVRKIVVHHLFGAQKIRSFRPVREDEVSRMIAEISKKANSNEVVDVEEMALSFTCSLLCRIAFGKKFDQGTGSWTRLNRIMTQFLASVTETFLIDNLFYGWINWISGGNRRVDKVFEEMDSFYQQFIDEHLSPDRPDCMKNDILDLLIQLREDHESAPVKIDWKHIKAILMNIYLGGTDSSAVTITWAMTALMKKPSAMKKVQQEIRGVVGMKSSVDEDDIEKLPYLKAVVKETLRLYPAIPLVPKETTEKSTINGYEIQPKTLVIVNIWAIGRDPEHWENPDEFLPERFLNTTIDFVGQDFGFIPFGVGRRICPGMQLAVATVELALANMLHLFNWELPRGVAEDDIDTDPAIGLVMHKKNPLYLIPKLISNHRLRNVLNNLFMLLNIYK